MGDWLEKNLPCFGCGSSDAMQESEHHYKCFSCNKVFLKNESKKESKMTKYSDLIDKGEYYDLKSRGISKQTCQKYNLTCTKYTGSFGHGKNLHYLTDQWAFVFNYMKNGQIIKQKIRPRDEKDFTIKGEGSFKEFYGQSLFIPDSSRILVITEGEFDALVVYQEAAFNAVSVPNGSSSLLSTLQANADYVAGWKYVVLAMDNDKAGQEAIGTVLNSDFIDKIGPHKIRIAKWSLKDPNDLLLSGRSPDIKRDIWGAEEYKPDDLFSANDFIEQAIKDPEMGWDTPFPSLTTAIMGWGRNTINTLAAADGIGKTEVVDETIHDLISKDQSVFLYSLEQTGIQTFRRQAGKEMNLPLHIPGVEADKDLIRGSIAKCQDKLIVWKPKKLISTEELIARMNYVALAKGVKIYIIDHLKGIESQMSNPNHEMLKLLSELKLFVDTHQSAVLLISHVAKDKKQGKSGKDDESWNRGRVPTKENIYGSSAISALSDTIMVLSRNVESENPREACTAKLSILKNRLMGNRGSRVIFLEYIEDTGRYIETQPIDYGEIDG